MTWIDGAILLAWIVVIDVLFAQEPERVEAGSTR